MNKHHQLQTRNTKQNLNKLPAKAQGKTHPALSQKPET